MRTKRAPALGHRAAALIALAGALAGCASGASQAPRPQGSRALTVIGNYEAMASCVLDVGDKSQLGAHTLRVDRATKTATVSRRVGPQQQPQYELSFAQYGGTTVEVRGRQLDEAKQVEASFDLLWSQVQGCANQLLSP